MLRAPDLRVRLAAVFTAALGVINVFSALTPPIRARVELLTPWSPVEVRHGGRLAAALSGFALLLLARSLWRRKRAAWVLTLAVLAVSVVSHLLKGLNVEEASIAILLAAFLLSNGAEFHARSDLPSVRQALSVLAAALAFTFAYGTLGFWLLDRHFHAHFDWSASARQTLAMFAEFRGPQLPGITRFGQWFVGSVFAVAGATGATSLLLLLRPVLIRAPATREQRERARAIVEAHGESSLARFTLFDDKHYFFTAGGSVVAFALANDVAVSLGDPIGPQPDRAPAILTFRAHCERNDWTPAFYQVLPDDLALYREAGFADLRIGEEAIVRCASFSLAGSAHRSLRGSVNRAERLGYATEVIEAPLPDALLRELRSISDEWLTFKRGREKRFSLGWFDDEYLRGAPVMVVRGADHRVLAFANLVPEYRRNELTIDLMRHRKGLESGGMDFLIVRLIEWARDHHYESFNLGLSALAGVGEEPGDPAVERWLHFAFEHLNRFYSFQGLHAFKDKFSPEWSPRYLIYRNAGELPAVMAALILADSGTSVLWGRRAV